MNTTPTIGASFLQKRVLVDNVDISLQIWDTAGKKLSATCINMYVDELFVILGQERFRSMAPMYYRGAKAAICVFDVTNEESFNRIATWLRDLRAHADQNAVICIAGNKCDKAPAFDIAQCESYAASVNAHFFRTSALSGEGVQEVFDALSKKVADVYRGNRPASRDIDALRLGAGKKAEDKGCCN